MQWYWKGDFVNELSDKAIDLHFKYAKELPTWRSTMHLFPINCAAAKVGKKDTAWNFRDANWSEVIVGVDPDPENKELIIKWARDYWNDLHPYSAGENYERLVAIKNKYDPNNFFRVNQNIRPMLATSPGEI
jgi:FAD/FMN-containing dehydrogenase